MPAEEFERLGLRPELDLVAVLHGTVAAREGLFDDFDRLNRRGEIVGQFMGRFQMPVLIVKTSDIGARDAADLLHDRIAAVGCVRASRSRQATSSAALNVGFGQQP